MSTSSVFKKGLEGVCRRIRKERKRQNVILLKQMMILPV